MKVTTAMLADAAKVESGKLYVHGGGWDSITASSFPTKHPTLAVVLVFRIEYDEALKEIPIAVELMTEDGDAIGQKLNGTLRSGHPPETVVGAPAFHPLAITFNGTPLNRAGRYVFRVTCRDEELARIPFTAREKRGSKPG